MKCPRCSFRLVRGTIDGVNVYNCGKCRGNLIKPDRLSRLCSTISLTSDELMDRWRSYEPIDTEGKVRCPECRSYMEMRNKRGGIRLDHDECQRCEWLWMDPGETELFLLSYKVSDRGKEAERFKEIHANMTDHEKSLLQQRIDRLKDGEPNTEWFDDPEAILRAFFR